MARRSLKPQLNQIRAWSQQGRTDAWIAHQLETSVKEIAAFKAEHDLTSGGAGAPDGETVDHGPRIEEEPDLRAEDEALVAAALEADDSDDDEDDSDASDDGGDGGDGDDSTDENGQRKRRRRGRRGGRGRSRSRKPLEGTFDHGEEGYGLWLDPGVQDNPVYAEHWAGHRPVTVTVEADRIIITRAGDEAGSDED